MLSRTNSPILLAVAVSLSVVVALVGIGRQAGRLDLGDVRFVRVEAQVNTFTQSDQAHVALDMSSGGDVVVVWDSRRQDTGFSGVFARWLDPSGAPRGPEEQVNVARRFMQMRPAVAASATGATWVAWESLGQDGQAGALMSRATGDEVLVSEVVAGDQREVAVEHVAGDRYVAVWTTPGDGGFDSRVAYRLFSALGAPESPERWVDAPVIARDHLASVASTGGGFVISWARTTTDNEPRGVFARVFDAQGEPLTDAVPVSANGAYAVEPSIAANDEGQFAVAWMQLYEGADYDVMYRCFSPDGTPRDEPSPAGADPSGWQSGGAIAMAANGDFVVAWNTHTDGERDVDIHARLFDATGQPVTRDFRVNGHAGGKQRLTVATGARRVAIGDDGRLAFAWAGDSGEGDETAANLTLLMPAGRNPLGDLAAGARRCRGWVAGLQREREFHLDEMASPHVPPVHVEEMEYPSPDGENREDALRGFGFRGFSYTFWYPPDPHMAAGSDHLMLMVNGGITSYEKDGTQNWQDTIAGSDGFWGETGAGDFVVDPEVLFDPFRGRFIAIAMEETEGRSYVLLAVSSTGDPNDPWHKYRLDVTPLAGNGIDSPNLAVDADAIYVSADFFSPTEYLVFIVEKDSVIDGGVPITTSVLHSGTNSIGLASAYSADAPALYMIEAFKGEPEESVRLWAIEDPLGSPSLVSTMLTVPTYWRPVDLVSGGTSQRVETFDARFWSAMFRNGSIWACHHISTPGFPRTTHARWYQIEMNGWPDSGSTPTLEQSGTIDPPGDIYLSFNSIFANEGGDATMVYTRSAADEFFSIQASYRRAGDPLGFMSDPMTIKESSGAYAIGRWGDYSAVVSDPIADETFWMHHEYSPGNVWYSWVQREEIPSSVSIEPSAPRPLSRLIASPNPTSGPTVLECDGSISGPAAVEIYDVRGRLVRRLDLGSLAGDVPRIRWDGRGRNGAEVAGGLYHIRLRAGGDTVGDGRLVVVR